MSADGLIHVGFGNIVNADKIIAIVSPDSAPVRRLVSQARTDGRTIDATQGRKTKSVIVMESDRIVLSALLPETIRNRAMAGSGSASGSEEETVTINQKNVREKLMAGKLAVISGFSGAGKGTVVKKLMEKNEGYVLSVSMTTRAPRKGEKDGKEYYFVTDETFESMIGKDGFLEHAGFTGHYYGTPRSYVEENLRQGHNVVLEIEVQGAMQIREKFPAAVLIFVAPPSAQQLEERLTGRGTEDSEAVTVRLERAVEEAASIQEYSYLVINDDVDACVRSIHAIIHGDAEESGSLNNPSAAGRIVTDPGEKTRIAESFRSQLPEILARRRRGPQEKKS